MCQNLYIGFFENRKYHIKGNQRSSKKAGTIEGEQKVNCWGQGCVKNDNWVHEYFEVPKWENNVVVRFTFVNGGESLSGENLFFIKKIWS